MNDNTNIDDLFRSGLEDLEMNPSEKSWKNLDVELSKKQAILKRKKRFMFFSIAFLVFLSSMITYKYYSAKNLSAIENNKNIVSTNDIAKNKTANSDVENIGSLPAPVNVNKSKTNSSNAINFQTDSKFSTQTINQPTEEISGLKNYTPTKTNSVNKLFENNKKEILVKNNIVNQKTGNDTDTKLSVEKSEANSDGSEKISSVSQMAVIQQENPIKEKEITTENNNSLNNIPKNNSDNESTTFISDEKLSSNLKNNSSEKVSGSENKAENTSKIISENEVIESKGQTETINQPLLTIENTNHESESDSTQVKDKEAENKIIPGIELAKPSTTNADYIQENKTDSSTTFLKKLISHISIGIYYSPDYVKNRLKVNDSYTGTASQNLNDYDNQKSDFSYSTGLNIRFDIGKNWSFGSGFSYSTFAQTAVYNTINVVSDSAYQKVFAHQRPPGGGNGNRPKPGHNGQNPHRPPGNGNHHYVVQTPCGAIDLYNVPPQHNGRNHRDGDTINIKTETLESLQFINIPLTLRYQFGQHKISYFVETGAAISFVKGDKVKITIDDSYTENNERDGLRNLNYSLLFSAGAKYNFYKGLSITLKPSFRYSITPVNQVNPLSSYPYYIGAELGFSIHF